MMSLFISVYIIKYHYHINSKYLDIIDTKNQIIHNAEHAG